jgi:hypothetical protein
MDRNQFDKNHTTRYHYQNGNRFLGQQFKIFCKFRETILFLKTTEIPGMKWKIEYQLLLPVRLKNPGPVSSYLKSLIILKAAREWEHHLHSYKLWNGIIMLKISVTPWSRFKSRIGIVINLILYEVSLSFL